VLPPLAFALTAASGDICSGLRSGRGGADLCSRPGADPRDEGTRYRGLIRRLVGEEAEGLRLRREPASRD
jgi:hypothetical protein